MEQTSHADFVAGRTGSTPFFQKLVVAVDFSNSSTAALAYAEDIARIYGPELVLTHVVSFVSATSPDPGALYIAPEIGQAMAEDLDKLANQLTQRGIKARTILTEGLVADSLEEIVQQEKPDLLVVGTHGAHGLERLIIGSTAEAILRKVSCPVLTIGPGCRKITRKGLALQTILYATVLQHPSEAALQYAASLARAMHAHVELVHAVDEVHEMSRREVEIELQSQTELLADALKGSDGKVSAHRVYGEPVEAIVHRASKTKADLIVLCVERGMPLAPFLPAGIAYRLICSAPCPVVTLKKNRPAHRG